MYFEVYRENPASRSSEWRWRLKAGNHEIIASGESYTTRAGAMHAVNLIKEVTARTPVEESYD